MILKEENISIVTPLFEFIDSINRLEENLSFDSNILKIRHIDSLDENLIQLEDFRRFYNIHPNYNIYECIDEICKDNGIDRDSVGFLVNESSLYENIIFTKLSNYLITNDFNVYFNPISENSVYNRDLMDAFEKDKKYDTLAESVNLKEFIKEGYISSVIKENPKNTIKRKLKSSSLNSLELLKSPKHNIYSSYDKSFKTTKNIANKYTAIKSLYNKLQKDLNRSDVEKREKILKQMKKLKTLMSDLKSKLKN